MPDEQAADPTAVAKLAHAEKMHKVARGTEQILNGDKKEGQTRTGWVIATFRQEGEKNHLEYVTNIDPQYACAALEELVSDMKTRTVPGEKIDTGSPSQEGDKAGA